MDFERYRTPKSVSEGVRVELPGTDGAEFVVALPSQHDRAFQAAQQRALVAVGQVTIGADDKPDLAKIDFIAWREARIAAFLEICVLQLPDGLTRDMLKGDYYPGLVALFDRASDLAEDEAKAAAAAAKKFKA